MSIRRRRTGHQAAPADPPSPALAETVTRLEAQTADAKRRYDALTEQAAELDGQAGTWVAVMETADGRRKEIPLASIVDVWRPNQMGLIAKLGHYVEHAWWFVSEEPRESNQEGGVFPAIFGTVLMTLIMSAGLHAVRGDGRALPAGVRRQGPLVRIVRIAVNNLAGVPSIVFGVFGLGFFVYFVGGNDRPAFLPGGARPTRPTGPAASSGRR